MIRRWGRAIDATEAEVWSLIGWFAAVAGFVGGAVAENEIIVWITFVMIWVHTWRLRRWLGRVHP